MSPTTIHLRSETKPLERRSPLSPASAKALVQAGFLLRVERCHDRIYGDDEFEAVGAEMVSAGSWVNAPHQHIILGLKELSEDDSPLPHTYIHFQHCFKHQEGWASALSRFVRGGGMLYDLEFLTGEDGRRVAAFGYWAGYAGAAIALIAWAHQLLHPGVAQGRIPRFDSAPALADHVKSIIEASIDTNGGQRPRIIIIGALGRCGKGALDFCLGVGIPREYILEWDMEQTSRGGPFPEVTASDIFINCVYLGPMRIPPFVNFDSLTTPERRLRVICDVSCDPNSENNPIPIYSGYSSFDNPTVPISRKLDGPELRVVAIDHLPTLIAREASDEFSRLLLPSLLTLNRRESEGVWVRAESTFAEKVRELPGGGSSL